MSRRLDDTSRNILEFRPQIEFVEPDVQPGVIQPTSDPPKLEDIIQKADETRKLAKAVDTLAAALQAKADLRAKDMVIKLDPNIDAATIAAMKRTHPSKNPTEITYSQYAECKENQRKKGLSLAKQGLVSPEDIERARASLDGTTGFDAGFNSEAAKTGGFRPERNEKNQIIVPFNMEEMQDLLMRILVNFLWKNFIKPIIPLPPGVPGLPDEIADVPEGMSPEGFAKKIDDLAQFGKDQGENFPKIEAAKISTAAEAGNLKATADAVADAAVKNAARAADGDLPKDPSARELTAAKKLSGVKELVNPFALQDCYTITRTFERAAAYCTTEESVFAMMRPTLSNIRIMAGAHEPRALTDEALLDGALAVNVDADEETTGGDNAIITDIAISNIVEDAGGTGAKKKKAFVDHFSDWLKDCFPCDLSLPSAGDFFSKFQAELQDRFLYYGQWYKQMLDQLAAISNLWKVDSSFEEICALINFFNNIICLPDLRRIIAILTLLLMRIAFEITGLFDFILSLVAPLILPFLSGIVDTVEKFLLAVVKPIECIIDSIINMVEKLNYNAIFDKSNIRDMAVNIGPQGRVLKSNGVKLNPVKPPRLKIDALGLDYTPEFLEIEGGQVTEPKTYEGAKWGVSFNFIEDAPLIGDHMKEEEQAVREAQAELEEIRRKRVNIDFSDEAVRKAYLEELEQAIQKRADAVDDRDFTGGQQLRNFLETFKKDMRSVMITLASYLREAIQAVEGFVGDLVGEFRKLMAGFLGGGDSVIAFNFKKMEIIKLVGMMISFIAWLVSGAKCDEGKQDEYDIPSHIPNNEEARIITVAKDGTITITERPELIEEAINNVVAAIGPEPYDPGTKKPGAEVIGTPADRSRQKLNSLVEFTGNPVLDTEIARVVDSITTPAQNVFKCPLQTSVAQAEQVNTWMRELNAT